MSINTFIIFSNTIPLVRDNAWLRASVRAVVDERFDGKAARAAAAWGMPQAGLQQFLSSKARPGLVTVQRLARHLPSIISEFLGMPGSGSGAELPQLDAVKGAMSASMSPRTRAYADALGKLWAVDRGFGQWAQMLNDYEVAHAQTGLRRPTRGPSQKRTERSPLARPATKAPSKVDTG